MAQNLGDVITEESVMKGENEELVLTNIVSDSSLGGRTQEGHQIVIRFARKRRFLPGQLAGRVLKVGRPAG